MDIGTPPLKLAVNTLFRYSAAEMAQPLRLPIQIMLRVDEVWLTLVDQSLRPGETRSAMVRDAALAEALRRKQKDQS